MAKSYKPPKPSVQTTKDKVPPRQILPEDPKFRFSLQYWDQTDNFGLGECETTWFISLFEKLRDMGRMTIDEITIDPAAKGAYRYHAIDWTKKNVPIQRSEITWIPENIRSNEDEYPIYQFQLSKGKGRIIGFWHDKVFNIVLLDPQHNMQPSRDFNYEVNPTTPLPNDYQSICGKIRNIQLDLEENCEAKDNCFLALQIQSIFEEPVPKFGQVFLREDQKALVTKLISRGNDFSSIDCVVEEALNVLHKKMFEES